MSVDPLAEEDPSWTPYRYCYQNPINYTDPNGLHEYTLDEKGNVNLANKTDDKFDMIYTVEDYKNKKENGLKVNKNSVDDKNAILYKLSQKETHKLFENGIRYTSSNDKRTMKNLFEFVASNSGVEWGLSEYINGSELGTGHDSDMVLSDFSNKYNITDILNKYHSHPCQANAGDGCDKASGYGTKEKNEIIKKGFNPVFPYYNDLDNASSIYHKLINAGKINQKNSYKGAPKFFVFRTFTGKDRATNKPYYFEYDPWTKRK